MNQYNANVGDRFITTYFYGLTIKFAVAVCFANAARLLRFLTILVPCFKAADTKVIFIVEQQFL